MAVIYKYVLNILIAFDQFVVTIFGGWPDETISSYAYRLYWQKKIAGLILYPAINKLFFWQENHCRNAYIAERSRTQLPPIFR